MFIPRSSAGGASGKGLMRVQVSERTLISPRLNSRHHNRPTYSRRPHPLGGHLPLSGKRLCGHRDSGATWTTARNPSSTSRMVTRPDVSAAAIGPDGATASETNGHPVETLEAAPGREVPQLHR